MIRKGWPVVLVCFLMALWGVTQGAAKMVCSECNCSLRCTTDCIDDGSGLASACVNTGYCQGSPYCPAGLSTVSTTPDLQGLLASLRTEPAKALPQTGAPLSTPASP
ncbi:MAG TPA: hypothetical protein VF173_16295 [Thermoanaerobaculia bacterium]|nr:hypothetical protein [Thermoanaerobaculia bacterium]